MTLPAVVGTWGRPPDLLSWIAVGAAAALSVLALLGRGRSLLDEDTIPRKHFLSMSAFVAALLSVAWISIYLRGGPRIIDATTYFLQGRALSEGSFAWPLPEPSASFRGRFLLAHDGELGGIFPPGYPFLLAVGFAFGAPMIVGPLLAAALVLATYRLARAIAEELFDETAVEPIARGAVLLSVACAALRYHTADTMSHGAAALAVIVALTCALRNRAVLAGLAVGWVLATRPVSALPIAIVVAFLLGRRGSLRALAATLPGVLLLLSSQRAVTGSWLASSQRMYYAMSDGPPDCFRWGFGSDVGCLGEHGDFVVARFAKGYGLVAALGTTLRRLRMHLLDVANLEPLALLVLVPILRTKKKRAVVAASALVLLQILAYAPFYFDGNYPGGGARFFADVLPVEHVLVVIGVALLARGSIRGIWAVVALALVGFAVHASFDHRQLADRDGGRPMYEPDVLTRGGAHEGLVYVDTDHGFGLAYDPGARTKDGIVAARLRSDDRDRLLFDALDRPPTWLYRFDYENGPSLVPWAPPDLGSPLRFEAEAEWPPLSQQGGLAVPAQVLGCASNGRALVLTPLPQDATMTATIALPVPEDGRYRVMPWIVRGEIAPHTEHLIDHKNRGIGTIAVGGVRREWVDEASGCNEMPSFTVDLRAPSATVELTARGGPVALDRINLARENH